MLKKKLVVLGLLLAMTASLLVGCSKETPQDKKDDKAEAKPMNLTIVGGRAGGVWSVFTEGVAESVRKSNSGSIVTVEPGSTTGNPGLVNQGKVQLGLSYSLTAFSAYKGMEPYTSPNPDLRSVAVVIPENLYQFTVLKKTGLTSIQDIKDKKFPLQVSVDDKGSMADIITRGVFEAHGFSYQDIESWGGKVQYLTGTKSFEMMGDGRLQAVPDAVPVPASDVMEASATMDLDLLTMSDDAISKVKEKLGMGKGTVPSGSYKFLNREIATVNTPVILMTNKSVSDEEIYRVVKAMYENISYLGTVHESFKDLTQQNLAEVGGVPLHPGAEKFYKEMGILK